jgi:hypothetical protein
MVQGRHDPILVGDWTTEDEVGLVGVQNFDVEAVLEVGPESDHVPRAEPLVA